jgi:hypothetical protein
MKSIQATHDIHVHIQSIMSPDMDDMGFDFIDDDGSNLPQGDGVVSQVFVSSKKV